MPGCSRLNTHESSLTVFEKHGHTTWCSAGQCQTCSHSLQAIKPIYWSHRVQNIASFMKSWSSCLYFTLGNINAHCTTFLSGLFYENHHLDSWLWMSYFPLWYSFVNHLKVIVLIHIWENFREHFHKCSPRLPCAGWHHSKRCLGRPLGIEENIGLSVAHLLHTANLHLRVITVDPETWGEEDTTG